MNLKAKFIIPTLLLIVFGMAITMFISYSNSTESLRGLSKANAKPRLNSLLSLVDIWIEGTRNQTITLGNTRLIVGTLTEGPDQISTSEEINRGIEDVNRISEQTAEAMRHSAKSVGRLAEQAQVLRGLIAQLQSEGGQETPGQSRLSAS